MDCVAAALPGHTSSSCLMCLQLHQTPGVSNERVLNLRGKSWIEGDLDAYKHIVDCTSPWHLLVIKGL